MVAGHIRYSGRRELVFATGCRVAAGGEAAGGGRAQQVFCRSSRFSALFPGGRYFTGSIRVFAALAWQLMQIKQPLQVSQQLHYSHLA